MEYVELFANAGALLIIAVQLVCSIVWIVKRVKRNADAHRSNSRGERSRR